MLGSLLFMVAVTASRLRQVAFGEMVIKVLTPFLNPNNTSSSIVANTLSPVQAILVFLILMEDSGLKKWVTAKLICILMRTIPIMAYRSSFIT
jgi:hypothetical protein